MSAAAATDPRVRADEVDAWLRGLLGDRGAGIALVAVGSLGRRELCPHSDLDLVLVHTRRRKDVRAVADSLWYPIWDSGWRLDHSVRTVDQALAVAADDLKVALGLLDARVVAGDERLGRELLDRWAEQWRKGARRFLPTLADAVDARHAAKGDVAFDLHPDLKDGRGGLRDVEALLAAARGWPPLGEHLPLADLDHARSVLLRARAALHARAGRTDVLALQEQDAVARACGYPSTDGFLAEVAAAARRVAWVGDDGWRRVRAWASGPSGRPGPDRPLGPGLVLRDGEVHLAAGADPVADPGLALRAAAAAATSGARLARPALDRLAADAPALPTPWPPDALASLVTLLGAGPPAVGLLEALDHVGLLGRLVPEWVTVRNRPQRNAYHRWTVDRHLCETAANAAALTRQVDRPDLLLLGAWLHDIGKGVPGRDHTDAGCGLVRSMATRMGLDGEDVDTLVGMVRHHLLLADTATRRDLADPVTADAVAGAVGSGRLLQLLWALTEADSKATGPAAWSPWKARLVDELVQRTAAVLDERPPPPPQPVLPEGMEALLGGEEVAVVAPSAAWDRLVVVAPDRAGVLATVAGVLAVHGLDVTAADVGRVGDRAVQSWAVHPVGERSPDWAAVEADVAAALAGRFPLADRLAERLRHYGPVMRRRAAGPAPPRVMVHADASAASTVVEVRCADAIGLLHRIAAALTGAGLDVRSARVQTLGHEVVDSFYVVGPHGSKLTPAEEPSVVQAVLAALG